MMKAPTYGEAWSARWFRYARDYPRVCAACRNSDKPWLHHRNYRHPEGQEPNSVLVWLCKDVCHRRVHRWHDVLAPWDRRPYRFLSGVTTMYIARTRFLLSIWPWLILAVAAAWTADKVGSWIVYALCAAVAVVAAVVTAKRRKR